MNLLRSLLLSVLFTILIAPPLCNVAAGPGSRKLKAKLASSTFFLLQGPSVVSFTDASAWDMDGTGDYISIADTAALDITDNMSVMQLVQLDAGTTFYQLFTKRNSDGSTLAYQNYINNTDGHLYLSINNGLGASKLYHIATAFDDGVKHQFGWTFGSSTLKMFVDGAEATVVKDTDNAMSAIATNNEVIAVGANPVSASSPTFGLIGQTCVWDTAVLATNEYAELWNSGTPKDPTVNSGNYTSSGDLVFCWLMESGDGSGAGGVLDSSGNGLHGSVSGNPALVSW